MAIPSKPTRWAFTALRTKPAMMALISLSLTGEVLGDKRARVSGGTVDAPSSGPQMPEGRLDGWSGNGPVPSGRIAP
jgi:hypothetical protein